MDFSLGKKPKTERKQVKLAIGNYGHVNQPLLPTSGSTQLPEGMLGALGPQYICLTSRATTKDTRLEKEAAGNHQAGQMAEAL